MSTTAKITYHINPKGKEDLIIGLHKNMDKVPALGGGIGIIDEAGYDLDFSPDEENVWEVSIEVVTDQQDLEAIETEVRRLVIDFVHRFIWKLIYAKTGNQNIGEREARRFVNLVEITSICENHGITNPDTAFGHFMRTKETLPGEAYEDIHVNIRVRPALSESGHDD